MQNHMPEIFLMSLIVAQKKIFVHLDSGADNSAMAAYRLICLLHNRNRFSGFFLTLL